MALPVVFFELRGRRCALPVSAVREVVVLPSVTPVPGAPAVIRGLAPIHGKVLPVLDLGVFFGGTAEGVGRVGDQVIVVDAPMAGEAAKVAASLAVDRVLRLGAVDEQRRPAPSGPAFVIAAAADHEGPALLLDVAAAFALVASDVAAAGRSDA